jgi:thiamine transport system substrate-binding protein
VDFGDVCLNVDLAWFDEAGLAPPTALADLVRPEYARLTVVEDPGTSSPGLAFLLATVATFGDPAYLEWWAALADNGVAVAAGWEEAYYAEFSRYDGDRPVVVSYASSPPAEVLFADPPTDEAPTAAVTADGACFRQIEFAGVLAGTAHPEVARQLVDFMLGAEFQADLPLSMFVYPVIPDTPLPDVFIEHATVPGAPATMEPATIAANRERWIDAWTETVVG